MTPLRWWGVFAVALILSAAILLTTLGSSGEIRVDQSASAPGFAGKDREVDRSEFSLAGPTTTAGPTTVPRGKRPAGSRRTTTTSTTTTTTTPPATTTVPPKSIFLSDSSSIDSLCYMVKSVESLQLIFTDPSVNAEQTMLGILINFDRYLQVAPPELTSNVLGIRESLLLLTQLLRDAAWNGSDPSLRPILDGFRYEKAPVANFQQQIREIEFYNAATCPA
ncbi:MAG: hypothetical protein NTX58_13025 [Actinobacteria bacterium]|nr:hypothetical protein [Actinomycetota bacterium]